MGAAACLSAVAVGVLLLSRLSSPPTVAVVLVERGRFVREVEAQGELQAVRATPILVPTGIQRTQTIAELAPNGSYVKAGQPVVVFDATSAAKDLADGRGDRQTAENKISQTRTEGERNRYGLALDRERAIKIRERAEDVAPTEEGIFSRHEIIESRVDRGLLERKTVIAGQKLETGVSLNRADVSLRRIERGKADLKIRQAEAALRALNVTAPHDGLLVLERWRQGEVITVGQQVWPGQKIAELPDLSELEAKVYLLEADAGGLAVGRRARLLIEGRPGSEYAARVSRVDAIAKPRHWRSPVKYFEILLAFDRKEQGAALRLGQKVRAQILLEESDGVLTVPRGALMDKDGRRVVYRLQHGRFQAVEVGVGALSVGRVVITSGLASGDRVALRDPTRALAEILKARGTGAGAAGPAEAR